ncbi:MAG: adenylosuccinate synthase [Chloroflexi bacterium]|nr:adenylosuccinate synthase [Chloroflexota bacterium]MCI0819847.1 adenylosuccinate synthase [Chloroflexota bacterium]MCI0832598.1 adenylosuccinate synthase [Chloroflexota bacterium]
MSVTVVIGGQWGDEGKGRIVDLLAEKVHIVARYSAGNNAGHTIINDLGEFKLHLVPAGIFYPDKICLIGNGCVVDPIELLNEIEHLAERGVQVKDRLFLSDRAHVLMPWHRLIDVKDEELRGEGAIGTTGRGVGPAFIDKVGRAGVRVADIADREALSNLLDFLVPYKNAVLEKLYDTEGLSAEDILEEYADYGQRLAPYITDTNVLIHKALEAGQDVLLEGAQGSLLDLDLGTYEYVTSSVPSSLAAGAAVGMGIGPTHIDTVLGVYKTYCTRVGNGPFPTELFDETGSMLREGGPRPEYGSTTGRPRRCGWFDAVAARFTAQANGIGGAALTRLDVLDQFDTIKVCTAYRIGSETVKTMPASGFDLARAEPIYEELPGWRSDTAGIRRYEDLPEAAQAYVQFIQEKLGVPLCLISVGPEREQAISMRPLE